MTNSNDKEKQLTKIVVNDRFGGFGLSDEAIAYLEKQPEIIELRKQNPDIDGLSRYFAATPESRTNPALVRCVEILGTEACSGRYAKLIVATFEGDKYQIDEYDGSEAVVTPEDIEWITKKDNENSFKNSPSENTNREKLEKVDLSKMSILKNSVQSGKTRPNALRGIYEFTQKNTTSTVLTAAIMHAQEISFLPKDNNQEAVNPVLIPYALKVINGAMNNPNRNSTVEEISFHTLNVFAQNNFANELKQRIQDRITNLSEELKRNSNTNNERSQPNIDLNTARVECATKYMGARGMDFVKDDKGHSLLVPRDDNRDLRKRIIEEQNRRNNSQDKMQKYARSQVKTV